MFSKESVQAVGYTQASQDSVTYIFPAHKLLAVCALQICNMVQPSGHKPLLFWSLAYVDHEVEEICFPVLGVEGLHMQRGELQKFTEATDLRDRWIGRRP